MKPRVWLPELKVPVKLRSTGHYQGSATISLGPGQWPFNLRHVVMNAPTWFGCYRWLINMRRRVLIETVIRELER